MNLWYSLIVGASVWLSGGAVQYEPFDATYLDRMVMTELGAEVGLGPFYGKTSILTTMYPSAGQINFSPMDNTFIIGAGVRLGGLDIGIEHECWHPMQAYQWVPGRAQVIPAYEGGGTRVFARLTLDGGMKP